MVEGLRTSLGTQPPGARVCSSVVDFPVSCSPLILSPHILEVGAWVFHSASLTLGWKRVVMRLRQIVLECVIPVDHLMSPHFLLSSLYMSLGGDSIELPSFLLELSFGSKHFFP